MATRRMFVPLAAAFAASLPLTLAMAAGLPVGDDGQPGAPTAPTAALEQAEKLLSQGRPVAARALLVRTLDASEDGKIHLDGWRTRAMELLARAGKQIRDTEPNALSLEKAEVALSEGDVKTAERHVRGVLKSATLSERQADQARTLTASIEQRRRELAAIVPETLAQAERDFLAGRYSQAKVGLEMVERSGARLTAPQQAKLDRYQLRLIELARTDTSIFRAPGSAGLMQPGVVKRREDQPAGDQPPAGGQPAGQPEQPTTPPGETPPATPPAQPETPAGGQPQDTDLIRQARRAEVQSLILQADRSYDQGSYTQATSQYQRILREFGDALTPEETQHVQQRIQLSNTRAGRAQPPGIEQAMSAALLEKQQAEAMFSNYMTQAREALATGNVNEARTQVAQARLTINAARARFSEPEYETYNTQANTLLADIEKQALALQAAAAQQQEKELQLHAQEIQERTRAERDQKIVELIDRARAYQAEKRYSEAMQAAEQILFLDPLNPTALLLRDIYFDIMTYEKSAAIYQAQQEGYAQNALDNEEAAIPPSRVMNFPPDWVALSTRRGEPSQFAEAPENRRVLADLNNRRVPSVAFNDNALQDVVEFIKTITQQNVDVDWASLENAGIQRDATVSLNLTNVTAKTLLDRVTEKVSGTDRTNQADWAVIDGVVTIASRERLERNTSLVIYDVRDLLIEVPDYTDVPQIDLQQALQASQQGGGGGQGPFRDQNQQQQDRLRDVDERLNELINIITTNVDFDGWTENGGNVGRIQKLTNQGNLIITNTPKNHRLISGLLSKLREIRAMQINVETRFLLVNQDWFEAIGFDLDVYLNANSNRVRAAQANDPFILPSDFFDFAGGGGGNRGLKRVINAGGGGINDTTPNDGLPESSSPQSTPVRNGWSPIGFQSNSLPLAGAIAPSSDWSNAILGAAPALGIAGQFLDDVQVDFLIMATQADRRSVQLTAPRVTFTNGQISNIYVATQTAFISALEPVVGDSAVGFNPTVGVATEGVTLLVEGTVTADRRYVTMNVDAGVSRIDGFAQQPVVAIAGGQLVNSQAVQQFIQLPQVTVTRVRSTVTVPDQGTLLMGGQRIVTEFEVETGVPVLSKIPIINRFFTNRMESKEEQTLLILVKPTILIQNEEEERAYPGLLQSLTGGLGG